MIALFDDVSVAHHKNAVGILYGREPVRNQKAGSAFHHPLKRLLDF